MQLPLKQKCQQDSTITPKQYLKFLKKVGEYPKAKPPRGAILCYDRRFLEYILKNHKTTKVESSYENFYPLNETKNRIGVFWQVWSWSAKRCNSNGRAYCIGVKKFISIGEAGSLQKTLGIGELVVCNRAIRDEGASYHYLKRSKYAYASKKIVKKIENSLQNFGQKYVLGRSWTIDAPYRETVSKVKK